MNIANSQRKPGILFLNMGSETVMPDIPPLISELRRTEAAEVFEGNANPLSGKSILTALSLNSGHTADFSRSQIDVIDLSGLRGALTLHNANGDLIYPLILESVKQIIKMESTRGHEIKTVPDIEQIEFLLSKPEYFEKLHAAGAKLIPTKVLSGQKGEIANSIKAAMDFISEDNKKTGKFIIKPGTSALAKGLVQLEDAGKPGGRAIIPHEQKQPDIIPITDKKELEKFLKAYLTDTGSYQKQFMLQPYIPNLEISQVNISGSSIYVLRIQGPTGIAHGNYDGMDLILDVDEIPNEIKSFIDDTVSIRLPYNMRSPYFLRTDIMIDLSPEDEHDNMDTFFQMNGDKSNGFLQLVLNKTGFDLTDQAIPEYIQRNSVARKTVTESIMNWLAENNYMNPEKMVVAEFEGAGGSRLWRSDAPLALYSYTNMLLNRAIPTAMRPQMPSGAIQLGGASGAFAETSIKIEDKLFTASNDEHDPDQIYPKHQPGKSIF